MPMLGLMVAVPALVLIGFAVWTVLSFAAAVVIGRALQRLEPVPVRVTARRVVDLRSIR